MPRPKIAISLDGRLLRLLDRRVRAGEFESRSQAIEVALQEHLGRSRHLRLARECAKLDPAAERRDADEGLARDARSWPAY